MFLRALKVWVERERPGRGVVEPGGHWDGRVVGQLGRRVASADAHGVGDELGHAVVALAAERGRAEPADRMRRYADIYAVFAADGWKVSFSVPTLHSASYFGCTGTKISIASWSFSK